MSQIIITEKQLGFITNKVLSENQSNKSPLNESLLSWENVLMAAGFVPVIGELADIALIMYYLYKGEKLYAALMLIALVPTVGDFIVKPIIRLFKGSREGMVAVKAGGKTLTEYLAKHPEMASKFSNVGKYVNEPAVQKTVQNITKVNSNLGTKLKNGLNQLAGTSNAVSGLRAAGKEVMAGGTFKTGLKDYFQGQRLSKYFAKHGVLPEAGIQKWWLNVAARQDRRNAFRKFISANNLLAYFGIPSLTTFEEKMSNDPEFRAKLAEDPKTSDYIAQNYEEGANQISSKDEINNYLQQRNSGKSASSIMSATSPSPGSSSNDGKGFLGFLSTIFGGSPQVA
jgi:hypothetical protein